MKEYTQIFSAETGDGTDHSNQTDDRTPKQFLFSSTEKHKPETETNFEGKSPSPSDSKWQQTIESTFS
jgi:hypothetical protein